MAAAALDSGRFDVPAWANWTAMNMTQYVPSAKDLVLVGPRMVMKLGSFLPDAVDNIFGGRLGQRIIPEATSAGVFDAATTAAVTSEGVVREFVHTQGAAQILVEMEEPSAGFTSRFSLEGARSLGSIFTYATSKWAICCIIMAVVLNRAQIYASTRRNLVLPWKVRLAIRIVPIIFLAIQARWFLQSIQCQTSPDFSILRWNNASKTSDLMFTQNGGLLHSLSSTLLVGASDEASCLAVKMIPPRTETPTSEVETIIHTDLAGSLSLLWPLFKTFSFSQLVETISCAVQGRQVAAETGMTLFEHSLAFAEADAAVGQQLGWGTFGGTMKARVAGSNGEGTKVAITRNMIMARVNTTPEVLLVGFLSAMNHLTSHLLGIFNMQGRLRLLNTGFWGLSFMAVIVWSISSFSLDNISSASLLRFPTVCVVGFIPHVLVLGGIIACAIIYAAALILSALAPPTIQEGEQVGDAQTRSTFVGRLRAAHRNMQANVPLSTVRVSMHQDFYTALLRTGFSVMTMASEAVYLNESHSITIKGRTWLEEDRLREIEALGAHWLGPNFRSQDTALVTSDGLADDFGLVPAAGQVKGENYPSGYAREMITRQTPRLRTRDRSADGVGATERSGRWVMAFGFFLGISRLLASWWASLLLALLAKAGYRSRPRWLVYFLRPNKKALPKSDGKESSKPESLKFWMLSTEGELTLPKDDHVDVEAETRRRMTDNGVEWNDSREKELDNSLYGWWLSGGWWGVDDASGNFSPEREELDDDTTSMISFSTNADEDGWESASANDDGRRTPTQEDPRFSRESIPLLDTPYGLGDLAELLHPKTPEQRVEAQTLATHLMSEKIVTRSQYRKITLRERAKVLTTTIHRPPNFKPSNPSGKLTPEEEAQILEHLILSKRRAEVSSSSDQPTSWASGASGMGEGGPQCVVCQSLPRSIIVWPCRCLSLCDDCRVTLASNNFDKCVCCRRDVASFSRIFVP